MTPLDPQKLEFWGVWGVKICNGASGTPKLKFWVSSVVAGPFDTKNRAFENEVVGETCFNGGSGEKDEGFRPWRSWNGGKWGGAEPKWLNGTGPDVESVNHPPPKCVCVLLEDSGCWWACPVRNFSGASAKRWKFFCHMAGYFQWRWGAFAPGKIMYFLKFHKSFFLHNFGIFFFWR